MKNDTETTDDRSPLAKAIDTATEVFSACLMMVLPGVGGHYVDRYLNTSVTFTLLGVFIGLVAGIVLIIKVVNKPGAETPSQSRDEP